jgi:hypothetical protein
MPAKIEFLLPEGSQRYRRPPVIIFGLGKEVVGRWWFKLEDTDKLENRLLVVEVDDGAGESRYYKSPPLENFPPSRPLLGRLAVETCIKDNLIDIITPNAPALDGEFNDKDLKRISLAISHDVLATEAKTPHEQKWAFIHLSPSETGFSYLAA